MMFSAAGDRADVDGAGGEPSGYQGDSEAGQMRLGGGHLQLAPRPAGGEEHSPAAHHG